MSKLVKQPSEDTPYTINFENLLEDGDSIASVTSLAGTPSGLTLGAASIVGTTVVFDISGGSDGVLYLVEAVVATTAGHVHEDGGYLFVTETPAVDNMSVTYGSLVRAVGRFLYDDLTSTSWTADQITNVDDVIAAGLRRFYWPPTPDGVPAHEWSFFRKYGSLTLTAGDYDYDLASDFSMLTAPPVLSGHGMLDRVEPGVLLAQKSRKDLSGTPEQFAIRPQTPDQMTGSRYEMLLYPMPAEAGTLVYPYSCEPQMIDAINEYPLGGVVHGETILEACLAAAEATLVDAEGVHSKRFMECLASSIRIDMGQQT